jgi:hypothetical protein
MTILLRTYRSLGIRELPITTGRSWFCRPTRRAKSSQSSSTQEPPLSASKAQSVAPKSPLKAPTNLENVEVTPIDIPTLLWYQRLGPVTNFFSWFHRTQEKRPYTVQIATSLTVYLFGDLLAQDIGGEDYDPKRTLRMLTIGAIASVPGYKWFMFLGNHFNYSSQVLSIATKVAVQQAVFTPVFNSYCKLFRFSETRISAALRYSNSKALIEFAMDFPPLPRPRNHQE